ncbi:uncharacterized protein LOC130981144 [Arachis stenosperma]|uniref:uncharacterized protein LOC130981144 n=1 Tax=Arachis stenosperma TaxID=217475 RepID=UPI0025ACE8DC|nr:uncharacterized protein LOC130981144 [Arachis stenosperma]
MDNKIQRIEEEIRKVDELVGNGVYDGTMEARRKALVTCCERWYVRKEVHWKQMSRSRQAKDMDKDTRYFHNIASARRRNNRIDSLVVNGRLVRNQARIKIAIREFYKDLYHQEASSVLGFREGLVERIDEEDSAMLEAMPSTVEIREAVWDCESSKAPGYDGYNTNFIKRCWAGIGSDFTATVMGFFQTSRLPAESNITWVALAPKFIGAKEIKDLRPISMVGCVYKVISKVLVRRMRSVMPGLVGETQSAFVRGRKIHDGALIACETVHWLKRRHKEAAIIKLDFQKAYDRVKWSFVDMVLQKMGFGCRWRAWVKECVTTTSMSVLINGSPSKPFKMERGLRQGDPLSPFLFVLVVDVLHRMVGQAVRNGQNETIKNYKRLLRWFELMSGLSINFDKSSLIPINCEEQWVQRMCRLWGCKEDAEGGCGQINFLAEKVPMEQGRWQAWYGAGSMEVGVGPKEIRGLGVGDAMVRNTALLFKWWWRFAKEECPLWKKVVCSCNNLKPDELLSTQVLHTRGGPWKDICQIQITDQLLRQKMITGLSMEVGDGRRTRFWEDVWLQSGALKDRFPRLFSVSNQCGSFIGECGFWDGLEWVWNFLWRRELFQWELGLLGQLHETLRPVRIVNTREDRVV